MMFSFVSASAGKIQICGLSEAYCYEHCDEILKLVNIIPYIYWTPSELLSQDEDFYKNKWNYSYVIKNSADKIIGVLIAYFRIADNKHIFDSLYIHRLAIAPEYQNKGIGTEVLKYFIQKSFEEIPWLLNISVQTNDNISNEHVIRFYKKLGFREMYNVSYLNKMDILLLLERYNYTLPLTKHVDTNRIYLKHPRFNVSVEGDKTRNVLPIIYFSSTNKKKKEMVQFIFHNYNIDVSFVKIMFFLSKPRL